VYKAGKGSIGADSLENRREKISEHFTEAVKKKRAGESADFISAIDSQSDISISVIGADNHTLEFEIPSRHVIEQIVAKTGLPPWMLGLHWSTTAFLSDKEVTMLLADVATRQAGKMPFFYRLIRTLLVLRGRTWEKGDWSLKWDQVNLYDEVKKAQARFLNLQGDYYLVQNAAQMGVEIDQTLLSSGKGVKIKKSVHHKSCVCSPHDKGGWGVGTKELQRPIVWTELDKVEAEYEAKLKAEWEALRIKTFEILKLNEGTMGLKEDTPSDAYSITEEQYAQMLLSMDKMIGTFKIDNPDSPLRYYYGESCSLGYLRAAYDIGGEAPNLNIIKNSQTYEKLMKDGFKLVKNDITKNLQERIMAEMQAQVLAGTNPRHVANQLKKMFGKANGDWERLARTEMSMAAEISKREEWKSWEIDYLEFFPSPDACAVCMSLAGEYPIDECPIPAGEKTHPRCRCTTTIGKRSMV
jgi:SPP1 gp7 family putative phage head morphogenesis protein